VEQRKSRSEPGVGKTLDEAMRNAYDNAQEYEREHKRERKGNPVYVVEHIELHGTNPFTEYKVFVIIGG
jgi:hypothetical protein